MTDCDRIDSLVTPYVDGDISPADAGAVRRHLQRCAACSSRVQAEQAVHGLMQTHRDALSCAEASVALRHRCAAIHIAQASVLWQWRTLAAAAGVVLVTGICLYQLTEHSTRVMAATLTADHVKCFRVVNHVLDTEEDASSVQESMAARFDWQAQLPAHPERADLELIGARPCVYPQGLAAHIMYRHHGHPVSLFMLPQGAREEEVVDVMGYRAAVWSVGTRTFVLIAEEPAADVERLISFVHAGTR
jgi:anti-sigma factor RsiW